MTPDAATLGWGHFHGTHGGRLRGWGRPSPSAPPCILRRVTPALAALVVGIIAAAGTYFAASRRLSGKIATSEASSLWEESAAIRTEYREQINADRERIAKLEERVAKAEEANNAARRENVQLLAKVHALEAERDELRDRVEVLENENEALKRTIRRMAADDR